MADIRATCPHGHTHRVAPHNMLIHIREQRYRWLCPPCGHWVDQTATVDTITMLHEFGVPGVYDHNPNFRALTPDVANREIAGFDPDLLLAHAAELEQASPHLLTAQHGGDETDLNRAVDQLNNAVDWMRDQILYHLDLTHPGHGLDEWRTATRLDPWPLAEAIVWRCPPEAARAEADAAMRCARRINDESSVYSDPGPWVEHLTRAVIITLRSWAAHGLPGLVPAVADAFTLAAPDPDLDA